MSTDNNAQHKAGIVFGADPIIVNVGFSVAAEIDILRTSLRILTKFVWI